MGKLGTLIIGAILIIAVLFIGYKFDTASTKTEKAPKAPKKPKVKAKKKQKVEDEYLEETDVEELDDESEGIFDYEDSEENYEEVQAEEDYSDEYFSEPVDEDDLMEESEYEEDDVSLFSSTDEVESTFDDDIDDGLSFETATEEDDEDEAPVSSSTMIFDTEKLNGELEAIDQMDNVPAVDEEYVSEEVAESEDFSDMEFNIDDQIKALDEDAVVEEAEPIVEDEEVAVEVEEDNNTDDAESFMNELKRMQELAEADDFSGFAVETKSKEVKDTHKKYSKRKTETDIEMMDQTSISYMPEEEEEMPAQEESTGGFEMNFLEQMEQNLKQNQKERLSKSNSKSTSSKTSKKSTKKKDE